MGSNWSGRHFEVKVRRRNEKLVGNLGENASLCCPEVVFSLLKRSFVLVG